jgi:hypothetical protein
MHDEVLIVGRGPSVAGFEFPDMPVMAVSSGVFAVPPSHRPPMHFVTMDYPKWFFAELHDAEAVHAWQFDQFAPWPFWAEPDIIKHIPDERMQRGWYRSMPPEVWDVIPAEAQDAFRRQLMDNMHKFSYQPGWGDFPNLRGWRMEMMAPPAFDDDSPIGMQGYGGEGVVRNSWFMAVQIAYKLGYRRAYFIGCDFGGDSYKHCRIRLGPWYELAKAAGMEWINLGAGSALAEVIPTDEGVAA